MDALYDVVTMLLGAAIFASLGYGEYKLRKKDEHYQGIAEEREIIDRIVSGFESECQKIVAAYIEQHNSIISRKTSYTVSSFEIDILYRNHSKCKNAISDLEEYYRNNFYKLYEKIDRRIDPEYYPDYLYFEYCDKVKKVCYRYEWFMSNICDQIGYLRRTEGSDFDV